MPSTPESITSNADANSSVSMNADAPLEGPLALLPPDAAVINATDANGVAYGLRASDRLFVFVLSGIILFLISVQLVRMSWRGAPAVEIHRLPHRALEFQIDINRATWVEWMQLPGIGEAMARRIVADRNEHGRFETIEGVNRVKGIGPATMAQIRSHLRVSPPENPHTSPEGVKN